MPLLLLVLFPDHAHQELEKKMKSLKLREINCEILLRVHKFSYNFFQLCFFNWTEYNTWALCGDVGSFHVSVIKSNIVKTHNLTDGTISQYLRKNAI